MPPLSMLIKPASSLCNLRCKYCFYHNVSSMRETQSYGIMQDNITKALIKRALDFAEGACTFAFQGGEPTLAGIGYFENFVDTVNAQNSKGMAISYVLQTNGIAIDENWAKFLSKNRFLVGLSLDGPKQINDYMRVDSAGEGTFNRIIKAAKLLSKYNVEYNILSVVHANIAKHAQQVYSFFKNNGFRFLQFIPCLDELEAIPGSSSYSLTPELYERFLITIFDLWYDDFMAGNYISVRLFDNLVQLLLGNRAEMCGLTGSCNLQFVVEADGGVYPCDFYVLDGMKMGNIADETILELINKPVSRKFIEDSLQINGQCKDCKFYSLCKGGCRRNREYAHIGELGPNYFCTAYKRFFEYALPKLIKVREKVIKGSV